MYYPSPEDIVSNQFTVNAMDIEELRRFVFFPLYPLYLFINGAFLKVLILLKRSFE